MQALKVVDAVGIEPEVRHLSNSAGALLRPWSRLRPGALRASRRTASRRRPTCVTAAELGLVPAMTARARLALVKRVPAGASVSYGHTWTAERDTTVGLVPVGYGDGVPRHASSTRARARRRRAAAGSRAGSAWTSSSSTSATTARAAGDDPVVLFGTGARRRADRPGLGRGLRHHLL